MFTKAMMTSYFLASLALGASTNSRFFVLWGIWRQRRLNEIVGCFAPLNLCSPCPHRHNCSHQSNCTHTHFMYKQTFLVGILLHLTIFENHFSLVMCTLWADPWWRPSTCRGPLCTSSWGSATASSSGRSSGLRETSPQFRSMTQS